jgi:hypothetical protein
VYEAFSYAALVLALGLDALDLERDERSMDASSLRASYTSSLRPRTRVA